MKSPEQKLNLNKQFNLSENTDKKLNDIASQCKETSNKNELKNESEIGRQQNTVEEINKTEKNRETQKKEGLAQQYYNLSEEQKSKFSSAQEDAAKILAEHIQGKRDIENLSPEESFVLEKVRTNYEKFKKENPDKPFSFDFAKDIDRSVYNNLAQKLSFRILESKEKADNCKKANLIRKKLGIPAQEIQKDSLVSTEENQQQDIEDIEEKDYEEFKVKNGETDVGVYWYEYSNAAAKKLKESGKLEWGKERIYFDIPLEDMNKLRDLVFEIAKNEKISIAFKHLDVQKTNQIDLRKDSNVTRFVANFASIKDAKRFYNALQQREEYKKMKSDRNLDYHGFNLDGVAHYASGYREKRESLKRIVETAQKNPDDTYSYYSASGARKITITEEQYNNFVNQYNAIPDPEKIWKNTSI